ncbi:MAG: Ger(x)C family spore germination protein [Clostridiaceae bacterium]|nr:Ger(x)C family spore germination protein [Clostridiaceae bacterium]
MKKIKLVMITFTIIMCPIILCGCWNYVEIDNFAIVAGVAIDKDITTNKYIITSEIITTQMSGASSIISSELYRTEGDSVLAAVRNTIEKTGLKLFWSDAKILIISKSIAMEGIIPAIDWVNRSSDTRPDMWVLISKEDSASEILKSKVKLNDVTSFLLNETMKSGVSLSKFANSRVWSFINEISSAGKSGAIATIESELNDGNSFLRVAGSAVFNSDKLVGYLNENETLYMTLIKNQLKEGLIVLQNVSGSGTNTTLEIHGSKTKLTPIYTNGRASLIIDIYPTTSLEEVQGTKDFIEEKNLKILQSEAENEMESNMQSLISKLQKDYHSDVLGFEEVFEKEKPKVSKAFKKSGEDIFASLKTEVNVHIQIINTSLTNHPITIEE